MREMFAPEKCPKCGKRTVVEIYDTCWRVICSCGYYGIFHFDKDEELTVKKLKQDWFFWFMVLPI